MPTSYRSKGPWLSRFAIRFLAVMWGLLIFWSLGLLVNDIGAIPGPDYQQVEQRYLDTRLVKQRQGLDQQIAETNRTITRLQEEQRLVGESWENLQQTIDQLISLQRSNPKRPTNSKQPTQPARDLDNQAILAKSLNQFLQNQETYQKLNQAIAQSTEQKQKLTDQRSQIDRQLDQQRQPAKAEFEQLSQQHRLKLAGFQLLILIPLLLLAAWLLAKNRGSIYYPLMIAFAIATLVKVTLIIREYFPERWVQYSLAAVSLVIIARLLVYLIRSVTFPKASSLAQQYREAYESFLCPVCEYPIRLGPRRYLFWTRRTVNKLILPTGGPWQEETYICPACGTTLFQTCGACQSIRHSLLPYCQHCGAQESIPGQASSLP